MGTYHISQLVQNTENKGGEKSERTVELCGERWKPERTGYILGNADIPRMGKWEGDGKTFGQYWIKILRRFRQ